MTRPILKERRSYRSNLPVEEFMLRVLKANIEAILDRLPVDAPNYKALDIGCGGQPFRHLFEAKGYQYVSADAQDPLGIIDHIMELDKESVPSFSGRTAHLARA